jgi:hypothetical protein
MNDGNKRDQSIRARITHNHQVRLNFSRAQRGSLGGKVAILLFGIFKQVLLCAFCIAQ